MTHPIIQWFIFKKKTVSYLSHVYTIHIKVLIRT